ncbi:restriction endonuclease subunit S [Pseudoalteromonas sp. ND6B]|jgi:type I restriction enzyme S subunit|uniref:restriction endonuclease subunit S n=1 Tax=Pseudoalteromonas sp. ND6B TaxID=1535421 RepID=UPI00051A79BF|nr:restriction endonuclease subunit S [Pseudoalteromonas sp. ND6B]KGK00858.1 restriction modification system DNA specificity domain-containing protein [Pseudoalteromonas sp. ND6B]
MAVEKKVPEIRFKGFSREWETKELGELAEIVRGASPRPIEDPKWFDTSSNVGWLRIRDVTKQDGRIHYLSQRISKLGQGKTRVLFEMHLLLSIAASVGKPVINYVETGVHDGFLIFKKPIFQLEYMYQWLKSFEPRWQQYGQPGSQVNLNSDIVKGQVVNVPDEPEQVQIGNIFQKLDSLINQHQQKHDKFSNIKKAMLEKMFPKQGETIPEIRFKGFSEEWEEKQLDDICNLITKQTGFDYSATIKPSLVRTKSSQTFSFIQNKDFSGPNINLETDFFIPCDVANKYPRILIDVPSVLISISGKIGNVGFYQLPEKSLVGGAVGICKLKCASDGLVTIHQLLSKVGQEYFQTLTKSSSHANITVEDIRLIKIKLPPTVKEKVKIGEYFNQLDALINQHQQQITKLNNIKQACLRKMFV